MMEDIDTWLDGNKHLDVPLSYAVEITTDAWSGVATDQYGCAMRIMALEANP